MNQLTTKKFTS